jgi:hypothetical protein
MGYRKIILYASRVKSWGKRLYPLIRMAKSDENEAEIRRIKGSRHTKAMTVIRV